MVNFAELWDQCKILDIYPPTPALTQYFVLKKILVSRLAYERVSKVYSEFLFGFVS